LVTEADDSVLWQAVLRAQQMRLSMQDFGRLVKLWTIVLVLRRFSFYVPVRELPLMELILDAAT